MNLKKVKKGIKIGQARRAIDWIGKTRDAAGILDNRPVIGKYHHFETLMNGTEGSIGLESVQMAKGKRGRKKEKMKKDKTNCGKYLITQGRGASEKCAVGGGLEGKSGKKGWVIGRDDVWKKFGMDELVREKELSYDPQNCAEAHLLMNLLANDINPKKVDVRVYGRNKGRIKEVEPCENCKKWVYRIYKSVNGKTES